jgi:hypothetical protein
MVELLVFALFVLVSLGGALLLYVLVREERERRQVMDRQSAERAARRDRQDDSRR